MKFALMGLGGLLVAFGLTDLLGSFNGFDLWGELGIALPDIVWKYSAYIELILGYVLFNAGRASGEEEAEAETENA